MVPNRSQAIAAILKHDLPGATGEAAGQDEDDAGEGERKVGS